MDRKTNRLLQQAKIDPEKLQQVLNSPDGQAAVNLLSQNSQSAVLQQAAQSASSGNTTEAVKLVSQFLKTPDGAALAEKISKAFHS